jgi:hypothetical protein
MSLLANSSYDCAISTLTRVQNNSAETNDPKHAVLLKTLPFAWLIKPMTIIFQIGMCIPIVHICISHTRSLRFCMPH